MININVDDRDHPEQPFSSDSDELVTLLTRPTEFEAHSIVIVLRDAGIDAFAMGSLHGSLPLSQRQFSVPVQVRRTDVERATEVLKQNVADSVDLDWDQVDVGDRVDSLPLTERRGMPLLAKIGFAVAAIVIIAMLLAGLVSGLSLI